MKNKVAVVIPNWNGEEFILECLASLKKQSITHHVVVVDNGSTDQSVDKIKRNFKAIELLTFDDNAGFAGGVNRGIRKAMADGFEYICLLNNDAVADKDWLNNLVKSAEEHMEVGIVTGKLMRNDKKHIDSTGEIYSIWGMPFPRGRNQKDDGQYDKSEYIFGASGGASLYRSKMFKEIGIFDEDFFAYFEDVDVSLRAQLAGWRVYYQPEAVAYHAIGGTSNKMGDFARFHSIKNYYLLIGRSLPWKLGLLYLPFILLQSVRLLLTSLIKNRNFVYFRALGKAVGLTPKTLRVRKQTQKTRKVPIAELNKLISKKLPPIIRKI